MVIEHRHGMPSDTDGLWSETTDSTVGPYPNVPWPQRTVGPGVPWTQNTESRVL